MFVLFFCHCVSEASRGIGRMLVEFSFLVALLSAVSASAHLDKGVCMDLGVARMSLCPLHIGCVTWTKILSSFNEGTTTPCLHGLGTVYTS